MEANGGDVSNYSHGGSSVEYADPYGTLTLVIEMAYYDDDRVNDQTVTDTNRRDAILAGLDISDASYALMDDHFEAVKADLRTGSSFETAVGWFMKAIKESRGAQRRWAETDPSTDRPATVAEVFSNDQEIRFYRLLTMGMLVRMLEGEVNVGNGTPTIRKHLKEASATFEQWASELEADLNVRAVPIRKLVSVQLGAVLAAAGHLAQETGTQRAQAVHTMP